MKLHIISGRNIVRSDSDTTQVCKPAPGRAFLLKKKVIKYHPYHHTSSHTAVKMDIMLIFTVQSAWVES